jgi:broad specificity phosphatase PhoE
LKKGVYKIVINRLVEIMSERSRESRDKIPKISNRYEVMETGWARWKADPASFIMADGARPLPDLWDRAVGNWVEIRRNAPGCSLVVSHGALGRCMVAAALGGTMDTFRDPKFQFDNCELVEVAWAPGAPAAACWRRLHRARTSWEAAAAALAAPAADSGAAGEAY